MEIPVEVRGENLQRVAGCRSGRPRALEGWAGSACEAGVAANRQAETIGVGKLVAEVAGEGAIEESVVLTLAIRLEVGTGGRVIESTQKAADLRATARAGKTAAFGKKIEGRDARGSLVREELNDAGHGITAVQGAFRAVDDLYFIDVIEGEIREIDKTAWVVERRAIDKNFCVIRIAAIEEESGQATNRAGASDADARLRVEKIGERDALALVDLLARDFLDGRGGAAAFERLGVGGNHNILRDALNFEVKVERPVFGGSQIENDVTGDKGGVLEMNVITARWNDEEIRTVSAGNL